MTIVPLAIMSEQQQPHLKPAADTADTADASTASLLIPPSESSAALILAADPSQELAQPARSQPSSLSLSSPSTTVPPADHAIMMGEFASAQAPVSPASAAAALSASGATDGKNAKADKSRFSVISAAIADTVQDRLVAPLFYSKSILFAVLFIAATVMVYGWFYIAALWNPQGYTDRITIGVLNLDAGFGSHPLAARLPPIGEALVNVTKDPLSPASSIVSWVHIDPAVASEIAYEAAMRAAVERGDLWAAIVIPATFSAQLLTYLPSSAPNASAALSLPPQGPLEVRYYFDQGRSYSTFSIVNTIVNRTVEGFSHGLATKLSAFAGAPSASNPAGIGLSVKLFVEGPILLRYVILHPVYKYGQTFASYVVPVLLWIGSTLTIVVVRRHSDNHVVVNKISGAETPVDVLGLPGKPGPRKFPALQIAVSRMMLALLFVAFQAFLLLVILLALGGQFEHGGPGAAYFFYVFIGAAFLSMNGAIANIVGIDYFQIPSTMLLILQLTSSGGIFSEELMPAFFYVGRGLPFYYAVRGLRGIYFGSLVDAHTMLVNCLVIAAYIVVPGVLGLLLVRRSVRAKRTDYMETLAIISSTRAY